MRYINPRFTYLLTYFTKLTRVCLISAVETDRRRRSSRSCRSSYRVVSHGDTAGYWLYAGLSSLDKASPYSITERRVTQLIPVLGSQPAGDVRFWILGQLLVFLSDLAVLLF